jgi:UDP-3-O-[3-hydroxymyristoyl] glucosamine N-acyltransferase
MWLSELFDGLGRIITDGEIAGLGFLPHHPPDVAVPLYDSRFISKLDRKVAAVLTTADLVDRMPPHLGKVVVDNPLEALWKAHARLNEQGFYWTDFDSRIHPEALISPQAYVAPRNVEIGPGTVVEPNATILERVRMGARCVIRAGAVLGTEGFEVRMIDGKMTVVPHTGSVVLGDDVQIMSNTCVCKSLMGGATRVGDGTVIDTLVHVAHNVQIGRQARIVSQAMLGGSCDIGDGCWIGPGACISNSLTIGAGARVTIGSVVTRDVPAGEHVSGNFAISHEKYLAFLKTIR